MEGRLGFWSYVHDDDDDEGGRITTLAGHLSRRVRLLTGTQFPIFLDKSNLGWGDDWRNRIQEALLSTAFFIPIITPSYFQHARCREELQSFASMAEALGLIELILPLYYVDVAELNTEEPSGDELIELVRKYQWEDFREVALEDIESSIYRKAVNQLAQQLISRATVADSKPAQTLEAPVVTTQTPVGAGITPLSGNEPQIAEEHGPGLLEILAEGEEAFPQFNDLVNRASPIIAAMGSYAEEATREIERNNTQGKGFAARLAVARKLAGQLEEPAGELEEIASSYQEALLKMDPMVRLMLTILDENPSQAREAPELLDSIEQMSNAAEEGLGAIDSFATTLRDSAKWSKDLRRPSSRIEKALRQMADARSIFRDWRSQVTEVRQRAFGAQGATE
jgi:hypothetical protein